MADSSNHVLHAHSHGVYWLIPAALDSAIHYNGRFQQSSVAATSKNLPQSCWHFPATICCGHHTAWLQEPLPFSVGQLLPPWQNVAAVIFTAADINNHDQLRSLPCLVQANTMAPAYAVGCFLVHRNNQLLQLHWPTISLACCSSQLLQPHGPQPLGHIAATNCCSLIGSHPPWHVAATISCSHSLQWLIPVWHVAQPFSAAFVKTADSSNQLLQPHSHRVH